ncbi:MAG TPA: FAD-binding oxidoreductase [Ignavibacteriaceae bacterium]|nr:FAD-binding oxidoreductase [Ignavibacteriaceae bacterium]
MKIKTNRDEILDYLSDASNYKGTCEAVYFPENISDLKKAMKDCYDKAIPVTISGSGTGLSGGRVPEEGIVISTSMLNKIIDINENEKFAVVEPGVILNDLISALSEKNLLYPPDPTEGNCFIGGTIATNASGEKSFKYGATRRHILELKVILPNGDTLNLKRGELFAEGFKFQLKSDEGNIFNLNLPEYKMPETKNASGYFVKKNMDAIDLFIGSEGTLGVIAEAKLKLIKKPEKIFSAVIFFNNDIDALNFIVEVRDRSKGNDDIINALALEFIDGNALAFIKEEYPQLKEEYKAAVWFEQDLLYNEDEKLIASLTELIKKYNANEEEIWMAFNDKEVAELKKFRHTFPVKVNEYLAKNNFKKLGTDTAVPDNKFVEFYNFNIQTIKESKLNYVVYGHFGNSHIHLNMLPKNDNEYKLGKKVYMQLCKKAVELGGTVSAEHGIGKLKTDYLKMMYGAEVINKMFKLKKTLDPKNILGRGNLIKNISK